MSIPIFTIAAYSGVGKTTYLEGLIPYLKQAGVRVAVVKHHGHGDRLDERDKDSARLRKAGADSVSVVSEKGGAFFLDQPVPLKKILSYIKDVDLILTEGYKEELFPKIALYRSKSGRPLAIAPEQCFAVVSDIELDVSCPQFPLNDPRPMAQYLIRYLNEKFHSNGKKTLRLSVEQAIDLALSRVHRLEETEVLLTEALGSIISRDIYAPIMQPPFHRSPLDGYAVRTADIAGATQEKPVVLRVVDKLLAGDKAAVPVEKGQAVRLMTGCMIPEGADYVVRQEDTDLGQSFVRVYVSGIAYGNYCCRGEEYQIGDLMLPAGLKLDAAALSVAAGAGFSALSVVRKVKAAILSIGNELQDSGTTLQVAKIYDANAAYLSSRLKQMGVEITSIHLLGDDCTEITETLLRCMEEVDIILSTGGVSVGEMDLVEQAVLETGAESI